MKTKAALKLINLDIFQMILIFVLAGAFAGLAREIGSVDATVNAALYIIPAKMIYVGLFLTSCIISFAMGTSVGTIVAVVPVACGIAEQTGVSIPFVTAIVVGGAFFGDNLSFISDTTIAATKSLGVKMRDKFKANLMIVVPAMILTLLIYLVIGLRSEVVIPKPESLDLVRILPYLLVIVLALCGINVMKVILIGILSCIFVGVFNSIKWSAMLSHAWEGVLGMSEVIIVALVAAFLVWVVRKLGWLEMLTSKMLGVVKTKRGAMGTVAGLVSAANLLTANNTVAILSVGGIAKKIAKEYKLDPKRTASTLDIFSCLVQSFIPYGAQLLMASGFSEISSVSIIPWLFYPFLMGICAIITILRYPTGD